MTICTSYFDFLCPAMYRYSYVTSLTLTRKSIDIFFFQIQHCLFLDFVHSRGMYFDNSYFSRLLHFLCALSHILNNISELLLIFIFRACYESYLAIKILLQQSKAKHYCYIFLLALICHRPAVHYPSS